MGRTRKPAKKVGRGQGGARRRARDRRALIFAGLFVLAIGVVFLSWPRAQPQPTARLQPADEPFLGSSSAPVTIVEYGDFGCTICRRWHKQGVLDQILAHYGDRVRFVWRDFPIITAYSPKAAEAGQCAFGQGQFWEYHDLLYDRAPALSVSDIKTYAAELGIDTARFDSCLDSGVYRAKVEASTKEAFGHGFRGTPGFLVNDRPIAGPGSFEYFQAIIDGS